jgi:hypothetical protein
LVLRRTMTVKRRKLKLVLQHELNLGDGWDYGLPVQPVPEPAAAPRELDGISSQIYKSPPLSAPGCG